MWLSSAAIAPERSQTWRARSALTKVTPFFDRKLKRIADAPPQHREEPPKPKKKATQESQETSLNYTLLSPGRENGVGDNVGAAPFLWGRARPPSDAPGLSDTHQMNICLGVERRIAFACSCLVPFPSGDPMAVREYRGFTYRLSRLGDDMWGWNCTCNGKQVAGVTVGGETSAERACRAAIDRLWDGERSPQLARNE